MLINFNVSLIKDGIHRVVNNLEENMPLNYTKYDLKH